ncbi:TlyA family RNA methyltransferase [Microbacterium radiodurans]|uniref:TlyA family RNA methyltransferase n=1 Tax=Microbacterium radiodurans TaxID=661398 RepID=A0A5J5IPX6_9MICO|nr:TlyA family RNA methyltransferase [Microbacterium radiodurans]KAA9084915.1 TlyA family RNA methyltransferase [Microbacterium radiodurans]
MTAPSDAARPARTRLDAALAARGLARSRTHATALIAQGLVSVDGAPVVKPSTPVPQDARIVVAGSDHYVSRAAHKLLAALDAFDVDVAGRTALDMGASTGGFTQVLRERGAQPVLAVDVGHGQLAPEIAADPGVIVVEGFNVRYMTRESLRAAGGGEAPTVVTGDLSFISLAHVLPAVAATAASEADIVLLVKPQFEVGRTAVKGGLVTAPHLRADAVSGVLWAAWDAGLGTFGVIASPLPGTHGNAEYVVHLRARSGGEGNPTEWISTVDRLAGAR